jgi:lipopolysaccharide export LptBFGC system permease protein LptF
MVFTLQRYIFRELLKVFLLATLALTLMLSLGSILRPVQEYGVGPRQVLHLMGYFLPITLTFVLPIAALFAASLVYGRFAGDNELDACRASGISLLTLIYPGLALAVVVAIANLILSFQVVPVFVHRAQKAIKADAKQILFRNIERKGYYPLPPEERFLIYADVADLESETLAGVVVVELKDNIIWRVITCDKATINVNPEQRFNEVQVTAQNAYQMDLLHSRSVEFVSLGREFGSLLGDDIKFKTLDEMKRIRDVDLMLFDPIAKAARNVYAQFTAELLAQNIAATTTGDAGELYQLHSGEKFVEFSATYCVPQDDRRISLKGKVVAIESAMVVESDALRKKRLRTLRAKEAALYVEGDELSPTLTLELKDPTWQAADGKEEPSWVLMRIRGLLLPQAVQDVVAAYRTESGLNTLALTGELTGLKNGPSSELKKSQRQLDKRIRRTFAEIGAEMHSRLVFGTGCVSMILIGIGLGISLKGGHLLSAFGASCLPAAILMVCILMGRNIAKNLGAQAVSGTAVMWGGLIFLCLLAVVLYRRLLKH